MVPFTEDQIERRRSVARTQRLVYNWYERYHNDEEVVDIYSPEWANRIAEWQEWLFNTYHTINVAPNTINQYLQQIDQIDLRLLFFAFPIAAFSLWRILQECYYLDEAVCPNSSEKTREWQSLRPFEYMESKQVWQTWSEELKAFKKQIRMKLLTTGGIKLSIHSLFSGLERLEALVRSARENFTDLDEEMRELMLKRVHGVLDQRCLMVARILSFDGQEHEELDEGCEVLGGSMNNSPATTGSKVITELEVRMPESEESPLRTLTRGRRSSVQKRSLAHEKGRIKRIRH